MSLNFSNGNGGGELIFIGERESLEHKIVRCAMKIVLCCGIGPLVHYDAYPMCYPLFEQSKGHAWQCKGIISMLFHNFSKTFPWGQSMTRSDFSWTYTSPKIQYLPVAHGGRSMLLLITKEFFISLSLSHFPPYSMLVGTIWHTTCGNSYIRRLFKPNYNWCFNP